MMRTKNAASRRHVAPTTKYAWVAAATLIVALMLGASGVTAQAQASIDADTARYAALGNYYQDGLQRGIDADAARYAALGYDYQDGLQRGIDADAARYAALGYYYQDGLQRGIDADAGRYAALGRYYADSVLAANPELMAARRYSSTTAQASQASGSQYTDVAKFYAERMRAQASQASDSQYTDVAKFYAERMRVQASQASGSPYTDVTKFYAERMRAQASQASGSPYTDVAKFYAERMRAQASQSGDLAANPELMIAPRSYDGGTVSCSPGDEVLSANPELIFLGRAGGC